MRLARAMAAVPVLSLVLTGCGHLADVQPGNGRRATITDKSYEQIWDAAHKVADEHFEIREQDKAHGVIRYERTMTAIDGGSYGGIYIMPPRPGAPSYTVEVVRVLKSRFQVTSQDWEYKVLRDIYRYLGLPALDPRRDP